MAQPAHGSADADATRAVLGVAIRWRWATLAVRWLTLAGAVPAEPRTIGSEFLPHLDEGAIWVRGTLAPSTGPTEGIALANQARVILLALSRK